MRFILAIFFLALFLHLAINFRIPLHSDVTWNFRIQVENTSSISHHPSWMREIGAYPDSIFANFRKWYQLMGRYNILDFALFRYMAAIAGDNADLWRLFYVFLMAASVSLFYLILKAVGVDGRVGILLVLALLLWPLGPWTDYKTSEPKALLMLLAAYLLILGSKRMMARVVSSFLILAAVLVKETFLIGYLLIPFLILNQSLEGQRLIFGQVVKRTARELSPYVISIIFFLLYFLIIRARWGVVKEAYVFIDGNLKLNILEYFFYNSLNLFPAFGNSFSKLVVFGSLMFFFFSISKTKISKIFGAWQRSTWLTGGLILTIIAHELVHFWTGRQLFDRYLIPGNFLAALLLGLLITPIFLRLAPTWQRIFFWLVLILMIPSVGTLVKNSAQDRIDQQAWQSLISEVKKAPLAAHVVLEFDDPFMIETAQSLEANTILAGRSDLTYHLEIEDKDSIVEVGDFLKKNIELFNLGKSFPLSAGDVLYVRADRRGGTNFQPYLNYQLFLNKPI